MSNLITKTIILAGFAGLFYGSAEISRAQVDDFFGVAPAKQEITLAPGGETWFRLTIANQLGREAVFDIIVSDIALADDPKEAVIVLDDQTGPYSLKSFISPAEDRLMIEDGEEATISILVSLPDNVPPGSLHGVILASTVQGEPGGVETVSRVGSLVFIKVIGGLEEAGRLGGLTARRSLWSLDDDLRLGILFHNDGNSYLNPYGAIEIKNLFGRTVRQIPIDPWFVLPNSDRLRDLTVSFNGFGSYTATLYLNRGYNDIIDRATARFFVFPWPAAVGSLILILLVLWLILTRRYQPNHSKK